MYTISKDFTFSASHQLAGLEDGHPCGRLHGHNYTVRVELSARTVDATGFVLDYGLLSPFGKWLDENMDHQHLNEAVSVNPTAENLARLLSLILATRVLMRAGTTVAIGVSETPKTWAWWRP